MYDVYFSLTEPRGDSNMRERKSARILPFLSISSRFIVISIILPTCINLSHSFEQSQICRIIHPRSLEWIDFMGFHASKNTVKKHVLYVHCVPYSGFKFLQKNSELKKIRIDRFNLFVYFSPHNNQRTQNSTLQVHYTGQCTVHSTLQIK